MSHMAVRFSVARLDDGMAAGFSAGWAVLRHEPGQQDRFASRIFFREQDASEHAHRLAMQEAAKARKGISPA